jgi:hypothetical protein
MEEHPFDPTLKNAQPRGQEVDREDGAAEQE